MVTESLKHKEYSLEELTKKEQLKHDPKLQFLSERKIHG